MNASDVLSGLATWAIDEGDALERLRLLPPGCVNCVMTSPPYHLLRSYLAKDHPLKSLELGSEPTIAEYIENMVRVFRLVRECLHETGTCFINIGDSYSSGGGINPGNDNKGNNGRTDSRVRHDVPAGNLCLIPQRLAIALCDDGWIVRSVICWAKPAPMPISVTGWAWRRCRVKVKGDLRIKTADASGRRDGAYSEGRTADWASTPSAQWADCPGCKKCENAGGFVLRKGSWRPTNSWEPVLMLAKSDRYFCDAEAVKLPPSAATVSRDAYTRILDDPDEQFAVRHDHETVCTGANPRDVLTIASEPLKEKHYAAFPTKLVDFFLRAGTSQRGYCPACGMPWVRVLDKYSEQKQQEWSGRANGCMVGGGHYGRTGQWSAETETLGWRPSCSCADAGEPKSGVVLDPFCGSGRTIIAARRLGLRAIGCELNPEYATMARRLIAEDNPIFNALPPLSSEPASLFDALPPPESTP